MVTKGHSFKIYKKGVCHSRLRLVIGMSGSRIIHNSWMKWIWNKTVPSNEYTVESRHWRWEARLTLQFFSPRSRKWVGPNCLHVNEEQLVGWPIFWQVKLKLTQMHTKLKCCLAQNVPRRNTASHKTLAATAAVSTSPHILQSTTQSRPLRLGQNGCLAWFCSSSSRQVRMQLYCATWRPKAQLGAILAWWVSPL